MKNPDYDVLIIGAGLSGIGAAVHLQNRCPGKTYRILEGRGAIGGTWDLFRYPGIRSDSDMHTLGYSFKPWTESKAIADGPNIRNYVRETADEYGVTPHIQFNTRVLTADWSSEDSIWRVVIQCDDGRQETITCRFLSMCGGYYRYDKGYLPEFPGYAEFRGQIIHPQNWPEQLDYTGKRIVVIGSGATAVTLVPALTKKAGHVTMLQRSPSYIVSRPAEDRTANFLRRVLPGRIAYGLTRWRNVLYQQYIFRLCRKKPEEIKQHLINLIREELGADFDVETHFTPHYNPWEQRLCLVPDSDLFKALKSDKATIVTDHIKTFTATGIELQSGRSLEADIIVTATGLNLQFMNGVDVHIDGEKVEPGKLLSYKGVMASNVPNLAITFGYTNASWTLKADLTSEYICRLINYMDRKGFVSAVPKLESMPNETEPFVDFSSGYFQRVIDQFPRQHKEKPWKLKQSYFFDLFNLRYGKMDDGVLAFDQPGRVSTEKCQRQDELQPASS